MDFLFHFSAWIVLPFWAVMIFIPHKSITQKMISSPWIIMPPVLCYVFILLPNFPEAMMAFYHPSPEAMAKIASKPWAASLFWAAAGAFDLFVGRWIYLNAQEKKISFWLVSPILFVCIFFGPLGFCLYFFLVLIWSLLKK